MDYIKRFMIAAIMILCVSLLFIGGRSVQAVKTEMDETANHLLRLFS